MNNTILVITILACGICCIEGAPSSCTLDDKRTVIGDIYSKIEKKHPDIVFPANCKDIYEGGYHESGIYTIYVDSVGPVDVYCDMSLPGSGWTVILKRRALDRHLNFTMRWNDYVRGFGQLNKEFMMGLNLLHHMTKDNNMELFIGLQNHDIVWHKITNCDVYKYARYSKFSIGSADSNFKLINIDGYDESSTAGDSLSQHRDAEFSSIDRDNDRHSDEHCAHKYRGGWWYNDCHRSQLTGVYRGKNEESDDGIIWTSWLGSTYSLKSVVMAIRPSN